VAAAALLVALAVGVLALTGDDGGNETIVRDGRGSGSAAGDGDGGPAAVTDDIVARARRGTIYIQTSGFNRKATGTGVLVDARHGLVLTNFHVVSLASDLQAGTPRRLDDAEIQAAAPCEDLALLKVQGLEHRRPIRLGHQDDVEQGDPVVALGYPVSASGGRSLTSTVGVVSSVNTPLRIHVRDEPRYGNLVQTDAALAPGNSGGPLVGTDGRLVGINTIVLSGESTAAQGYAIGVDRVRKAMAYLRHGRSRAWFGAGLITPSRGFLRRERLPAGLLLTGVQGGTSAASLGLDDVLVTAVDGRRVRSSLASYCRAIGRRRSGDTIDLRIIRTAGGSAQTVRVRLD
jgi:S1-C subfamily serine protease